jgi:hypothetical protein
LPRSDQLERLEQRCLLSARLSPGAELELAGGAAPDAVDQHLVRIAYLIPSNRAPQSHGVATLQNAMKWFHAWYADQMWRNGFGEKTFVYETEPDGVTPKINVVPLPQTDAYYRDDEHDGAATFDRVVVDAAGTGIGVLSPGQVWMLVFEAHQMHPDGTLSGDFFGGLSYGSGSAAGLALLGSDTLALIQPQFLADDRPYHGLIVPELGPYPMVRDVTCPWFVGGTLSSVASSLTGGYLHELTHGFGPAHDFRDDENFHGNLMGNGLRGFRGNIYPARYPNEQTRLSYGIGLELNSSRYFNSGQIFSDVLPPTVTCVTEGSVAPVNGLLHVSFDATDNTGLAAALLWRDGVLLAQMPISGTSFSGVLTTPWYEPLTEASFRVEVCDVEGFRGFDDALITLQGGLNRAPLPHVRLSRYTPMIGQGVMLDASGSVDPDGLSSALLVQWDLDGDGTFDTPLSTTKTYSTTFGAVGVPTRVKLRVVDLYNAEAVSQPIGIRVVPRDFAPPTVDDSRFAFATAPHKIGFTFSEDVWGSFGLEDVLLENLTTGAQVPASAMFLTLGPNRDATITFPGFAGGILPDGRYRATLLAAGIQDAAANAMAADHLYDFFFLRGDTNHDAVVNLLDFNVLAINFGRSPRDFTQGDFNYDGTVNLQDFNILAERFGVSLAPAGDLLDELWRGPQTDS